MSVVDQHRNAEIETAWAAGLFEGEGCIHVSKTSRWARVNLTVSMTDRDVVERFAAWAGAGRIRVNAASQRNLNWQDAHVWTVSGHKAEPIIRALMPHFGIRRRAKSEEALEAIARIGVNNRDKTHCPAGHPYNDSNTRLQRSGARVCKACNTRDVSHGST